MIAMKEPSAGSHISTACKDAVALAQRMRQPIGFTFNGVPVTVSTEDTAASAERRWSKDCDDRAEAYRNSPAGKAAAENQERSRQRHQREADVLIQMMPGVAKDRDALLLWVASFTEAVDHVGVKWDMRAVAKALTDAGYKRNHHIGDKPDSFNNRAKTAEYIIGQMLDCIEMGMGPHPITATFVEKYFALAE